jgi:ElaA protein
MEWTWRRWEELSVDELYRLMVLRQAVFVMEQNCVYQDADGYDARCEHLLGMHGGELAACARIVPPGVKGAEPAIGRVVTAQSVRLIGFGR